MRRRLKAYSLMQSLIWLCIPECVHLPSWQDSLLTSFHDTFTKPEVRTAVAGSTPLRRQGRASEVAETVLYLASDDAAFVTGANLDINGGMYFS